MAKHPVPKLKVSKTRTRRRYAAFQRKTITKLVNETKLVACDTCGAMKRSHHLCEKCGTYKGRQVINVNKPSDKIKTIKV